MTDNRTFTLDDQLRFARLSGDYNPIHVDPVAARRLLFGKVVVHGVHLALWAMDRLVAQHPALHSFAALRVNFDSPVGCLEDVKVHWSAGEGAIYSARILQGERTVCRLRLNAGQGPAGAAMVPSSADENVCRDRTWTEVATAEGKIPLRLPAETFELFPGLARFSAGQLAAMLAATRLVGMEAPGLHSLFSAIELAAREDQPWAPDLTYGVRRADERFGLVDFAVDCGALAGRISAFMRPAPMRQKSMIQLAGMVPAGEFSGQRALVVGGSRGLGEVTAKLLALGGARVTISYSSGEGEAAAIAAEAGGMGASIDHVRLDVARDGMPPAGAEPWTHIYYFASPKIAPNGRDEAFDADAFDLYRRFYVDGLARLIAFAQRSGAPTATLWFPSTVFIDTREKGFKEYAAAKIAAEQLAGWVSTVYPPLRCTFTRLPKLATDQTQAIGTSSVADNEQVMLPILRGLAGKPA